MVGLFTAACSAGNALRPVAAQDAALPALAGLDAVRAPSSVQWPIDVTAPMLEQNTAVVGDNLGFTPPGGGMAYAVYRIDPPVESVVSIAAGGADGMYLLVADYAKDSWTGAVELSGGFAIDALDSLGNPFSPGGHVYCAVVAPSGVQGQLTSLALNYDGPANIYYVAPPANGGDNGNPGTAEEPWATPDYAAGVAGPDSLIIVRPGIYPPFVEGSSGEEGAPIIWHGEPGAVIDALGSGYSYCIYSETMNWVTIEGFTLAHASGYGIASGNAGVKKSHNTVRNNTIQDCQTGAIRFVNNDYLLIEGNTCEGTTSGDALQVSDNSDYAVVRHNIVRNNASTGIAFFNSLGSGNSLDQAEIIDNILTNNGTGGSGSGLALDGVKDSEIANNLVAGNPTGIWVSALNGEPSTGDTLANNTVVQQAEQGSCIVFASDCINNKVYNNILFCANPAWGALQLDSSSLTGFVSDDNIFSDNLYLDDAVVTFAGWQSATLRDANSQISLPGLTFVNPATPDFHLLGTASAVGAALADYAPADDLDGVARPQGGTPDCGCFEYVP